MGLIVYNVASFPGQRVTDRVPQHPTPAPSFTNTRTYEGASESNNGMIGGLSVCVCTPPGHHSSTSHQPGSYNKLVQQVVPVVLPMQPAAAAAAAQQQGCTWPHCGLPAFSSSSRRDTSTHALRRNGSSIGRINGFGGSTSTSSNSSSGASSTSSNPSPSSSTSPSSNPSSTCTGCNTPAGAGRGRLQAGAAVAELHATEAETASPLQQLLLDDITDMIDPDLWLQHHQQQQQQLRMQQQAQVDQRQQAAEGFSDLQQQRSEWRQQQQQLATQLKASASPDEQLLFAVKHASSYGSLCRLVAQHLPAFEPHHTAAAILRLGQLVVRNTQARQLGLLSADSSSSSSSSSSSGSSSNSSSSSSNSDAIDSYDGYDQDWAGSGHWDAPHLHGLSSGPSPPAAPTPSSNSSSSNTSSSDTSSSDSQTPYLGDVWQQQLQQHSIHTLLRSSRSRGLAGLVPARVAEGEVPAGPEHQQQELPPSETSSSSSDTGLDSDLLSGATMTARVAALRQQQAEQAALVRSSRQPHWKQSRQQQAADTHHDHEQQQQQQALEVCYDGLLDRLLQRVRRQTGSMSASSGLSVLTGLAMLQRRDSHVLSALLEGPLLRGLPKLRPSGFVAVAVRQARLRHTPAPRWLNKYAAQLLSRWSTLSGPQLAAAVLALHRLGFRNWAEGTGAALAATLAPHLGRMQAAPLLWAAQAVAAVGHQADASWGEGLLLALRPQLPSLTPAQLSALLTALARLQVQPGDTWLRAFFTACPAHCLSHLPPSAFPELLTALRVLRLRPDATWLREVFAASRPLLAAMSSQQLAATAVAAAQLGFTPPDMWVASLAAASLWKLGPASPSQLASLAEALVKLRAHPGSAWLTQYAAAADAAMVCCSAEELARLVAAAAALKHSPAPGWLARVEAASHDRLGTLSPGGLATLADAMRALAAEPSLSWVYAFVCAAYPRLDQFEGGQLNSMFDALPVLAGAGGRVGSTWLDDMVQICCFELPARQAQRDALTAAAAAAAGGAGKHPSGTRRHPAAQVACKQQWEGGKRQQRVKKKKARLQQGTSSSNSSSSSSKVEVVLGAALKAQP